MFGTAEPENSPPPPAPPPANALPEPPPPPYQTGIHVEPDATRPSRSSSRLRWRTLSISAFKPSAVPQTTAWSGVSSQESPASLTTWSIERDWSIVFFSVRRYAASIARIMAPGRVTVGICLPMTAIAIPATRRAIPRNSSPLNGMFHPR